MCLRGIGWFDMDWPIFSTLATFGTPFEQSSYMGPLYGSSMKYSNEVVLKNVFLHIPGTKSGFNHSPRPSLHPALFLKYPPFFCISLKSFDI